MFKQLNYIVSSIIPQKIYWFLAGLVHPYQTVLEDVNNSGEIYQNGGKFDKNDSQFLILAPN